MTWHEYTMLGHGPTFWFVLLGGLWVWASVGALRSERRLKTPAQWVGGLVKTASGLLVLGLICGVVLADRVSDHRELLASQAAYKRLHPDNGTSRGYGGSFGSGAGAGSGSGDRASGGGTPYTAPAVTPPTDVPAATYPDPTLSPSLLPSPPPAATPQGDVDTVGAYFDAINAKDWPTVWALGGRNLNATYEQMIAGYRRTSHDDLFVYRHVGPDIRVAVLARTTGGTTQLYTGRYTVETGVITSGTLKLLATDQATRGGRYEGVWGGHGRNATITRGGLGVVSYRTYQDCATSPAQPCDTMDGDYILDGGLEFFQITTVTSNHAAARVFGPQGTGGREQLTLGQHEHVLTLRNFVGSPFCDDTAPASACGA